MMIKLHSKTTLVVVLLAGFSLPALSDDAVKEPEKGQEASRQQKITPASKHRRQQNQKHPDLWKFQYRGYELLGIEPKEYA